MELIDTHCHLTAFENLDEVFANAKKCEVNRMICVGASDGIESSKQAVALSEAHDFIWATIGVHPHDAGKFSDLSDLAKFFDHPRVVAIGETGLDYFRDWAPVEDQKTLFRNTIAVAREVKKPIVIHCRDAAEDTISILKECSAKDVGGVFHCYAEDAEFARQLEDLNFIVSVTGNITFKKATALRDAIREIPLERIMLETDCPYMAPEPFRGKPSEPMHVYQVARQIAEVKEISLEAVATHTTANAERLFGLS